MANELQRFVGLSHLPFSTGSRDQTQILALAKQVLRRPKHLSGNVQLDEDHVLLVLTPHFTEEEREVRRRIHQFTLISASTHLS